MLPGISYPRKTKRNDSDQVSRYSILCEKIRIKLERNANIATYQRSLVSFCLDSIASCHLPKVSLLFLSRLHSFVDRSSLRRARLSKPYISRHHCVTRKTQIQCNGLKKAWYYPSSREVFRLETFYTWNKVGKISKGKAMTRSWEMFNT